MLVEVLVLVVKRAIKVVSQQRRTNVSGKASMYSHCLRTKLRLFCGTCVFLDMHAHVLSVCVKCIPYEEKI